MRSYATVEHGSGPAGSKAPMFSASRNEFADTAVIPSGCHLQNFSFTTGQLLGPSTLRLERTAISQHSDSDSITSPRLTITRGIKETEAIKTWDGEWHSLNKSRPS